MPAFKPIEAESRDEKFLPNITRLIEDHLSEPELDVNALYELSGISNRQIHRRIKQLIRVSPVEYIKSTRMKKAAMSLQQGKFITAEVMYMVGFFNHSYLSKCFQAESRKTPRQYPNEDPWKHFGAFRPIFILICPICAFIEMTNKLLLLLSTNR